MKLPTINRLLSRDYIRKLASLLANREKVTVRPANHWATNVKERVLYYDENALRRFNETHVLGFMLHEIGHINNTGDIDTNTEIFTKHPSVSKSYINGLEDIRIDSIMSRKYAGSMEVIEAMHEQATSYSFDTLQKYSEAQSQVVDVKNRAKRDQAFGDSMTSKRAELALPDIEGVEKVNDVEMMLFAAMTIYYRNLDMFDEVKVLSYIKPEHRNVTHEIVHKVADSGIEFFESTDEVQKYFEDEIYPIIEQYLPPEESQESKQNKGNSGDAGQGKKNLNELNAQSKDQPQPGQDDKQNRGDTEAEYDDEGNQINKQPLARSGNDSRAKDTSRASVVNKALPEQVPNSKALVSNMGVGKQSGGSRSDYARAESEVRTQVNNLNARMNRILRDNSFERFNGRHRSGRLRKSGLYRFMTNDTRLFQRKNAIQNKSYAISLVIDGSGSMQGGRWNESLKAVALLTSTCKKLNVPVEITMFSSSYVVAKPFHQPIKAEFFDNLVGPKLFGGTNIGDAIVSATKSLNHRPENQKLMIVLTDGEIDMGDKHQVHDVQSKNPHIGFYGIGVDVDIRKHFPKSADIKDTTQIPIEFANILKANIKRNG